MAIFTFNNHTQETNYPDTSIRAKLGNSYQFTAPPSAPDQREFTLKFAVMKWYLDGNGNLDLTQFPAINLAVLDAFYNRHKLWATFTYPHPVYGNLPCKFNKPLKIPAGEAGGNGAVKNIEINLIEAPGMIITFGA